MDEKQFEKKFQSIKEKMKCEGLSELAINNFKHYYKKLLKQGKSGGLIPDNQIEPVEDIPHYHNLGNSHHQKGKEALSRTLMIKLNGGLGTSMGLNKAKSLLEVKNGYSFLEIIINQAIRDNVPLILMNSFRTREDSLEVINRYPELNNDVPPDFIQHKVPKILKKNLNPADYPENREYEWCPPGHGDIYNALIVSGTLEELLSKNYKYAFVSNSDNLGGVVNPAILGYLAENNIPFMMEVAERTPADKKGGHLARMKNGQLILREIAQCPAEDIQNFQNIQKYKYFNTNNLWIDLEALKKKVHSRKKGLTLPMICNEKHLNPRDQSTPKVFQLESAMGSAIARFKNSAAMVVPKKRFLPVKKTNSLLNIRSDNYILKDNFEIIQNPAREYDKCTINLDPDYYKLIDDMEIRFPYGPPSLLKCRKLNVIGDVKFGKNLEISGEVSILNSDEKQKVINNIEIKGKLKL